MSVQDRHLKRFDKMFSDRDDQGSTMAVVKQENMRLQSHIAYNRSYVNNFLAQVWRTIHEESPDTWPIIFGKLYADYYSGACNHWERLASTIVL